MLKYIPLGSPCKYPVKPRLFARFGSWFCEGYVVRPAAIDGGSAVEKWAGRSETPLGAYLAWRQGSGQGPIRT